MLAARDLPALAASKAGWATAVVLGALLVTVSVVMLSHDRSTPTTFTVAATHPRARAPAPEGSDLPGPAPAISSPPPSPAPVLSTAPAVVSPAASFGLRLPSLDVTAVVRQVITKSGVLQVPANPAEVGWWTGSAQPGSGQGSTVIDGHVDSAQAGPGALFRLGDLHPGDPVQTTLAGARAITYRVTARSVYLKSAGLPASLFALTGAPRLVLISCGGPFDRAARSYRDNIVVFATPAV